MNVLSLFCLCAFSTEQLREAGQLLPRSLPADLHLIWCETVPHGGHSTAFPRQPTPCPHYWLVVRFILFVLLMSNLNFLPLLLICLLTMDLENKLYLSQQIILFSKITIRNNVDTMSSGCIPIFLSNGIEILLLIPLLSEFLVQKQCSFNSLLSMTSWSEISQIFFSHINSTDHWPYCTVLCLSPSHATRHKTFTSPAQLPLPASTCPPPLLVHTVCRFLQRIGKMPDNDSPKDIKHAAAPVQCSNLFTVYFRYQSVVFSRNVRVPPVRVSSYQLMPPYPGPFPRELSRSDHKPN